MKSPKGRLELTWMGKDLALIPSETGKYDYEWVDRSDPRACEVKSIEITKTVGDSSSDQNLLIIGDSGDALRSLGTIPEWSDKYRGKIKLVYIDPPFNTEQAFDHYADALEHSVWLTMMRDRLSAIKPLMAEDASIWVHLDDAEVAYCRILMDEIFGREGMAGSVIWRSTDNSNNDAQAFSSDHNTILVYGRAPEWRANRLQRGEGQAQHYGNPDGDPRGPWFDGNPLGSPKPRDNLRYTITSPQGHAIAPPANGWRWSRPTLEDKLGSGEIRFTPDGRGIRRRTYLWEQPDLPPSTLWSQIDETGSNRRAKSELKRLFPGRPTSTLFDTPKPEGLLQKVLLVGSNPGDLVLDCFAGSGTTAAVAHKMGRRWVTIELQQTTVDTFTVPRLTTVIEGDDPGGITSSKERVAVGELPDGVSPREAQAFTRMLKIFAETVEGLDETTLKALRTAAKTKDQTTKLWEGGGGFTVATMGPSMFEVDPDDGSVYLSGAATNGAFSKAIAGQLKYRRVDGHPVFCGVKGRSKLVVVDGVADTSVVRTVVEHLGEGERAVIVAKSVLPDAGDLLEQVSPGSRLRKAPDDLFPKATVK